MRQFILVIVLVTLTSSAFAQCPTQFRLSGSNTQNEWKRVTPRQWSNMLPRGWVDKGYHFYTRVKDRGTKAGITTPGELESEINRKISDTATDTPGRRQITLNVKNDKNKSLTVIYDYAGRRTSKCELVTMTWVD